jgi:hypothetical protein
MSIYVRHGNYPGDYLDSYEWRGNLKGLSHESGWVNSAENLGASPFKTDLSIDTNFSHVSLWTVPLKAQTALSKLGALCILYAGKLWLRVLLEHVMYTIRVK